MPYLITTSIVTTGSQFFMMFIIIMHGEFLFFKLKFAITICENSQFFCCSVNRTRANSLWPKALLPAIYSVVELVILIGMCKKCSDSY